MPGRELNLDAMFSAILERVKVRGVKRLFIDNVAPFMQAAQQVDRFPAALTRFGHDLRQLGVTSIIAEDSTAPRREQATAGMADNVVLIQCQRLRAQLHRFISVVKSRDARYDTSTRLLHISKAGLVVDDDSSAADALLAASPLPYDISSSSTGGRG